MSILITGGDIVTAADRYQADLLIENGKITRIGLDLSSIFVAERVIDATGLLVLPGAIDPHTHLDMPFMGTRSADDFESGTLAALHGGTTTVIDFAIQSKGHGLNEALDTWSGFAEGRAVGDYAFHLAVTDFNDQVSAELPGIITRRGVTSFKAFMAYKGSLMIDDRQLLLLLEQCGRHGGLLSVHATNGDMIDQRVAAFRAQGKTSPLYHWLAQCELTEEEATGRFLDLAHLCGTPVYIVHLTCEGALNKVRNATKRNQQVFVETCPQYLLLDASLYERGFEAAKWVMSPPLRLAKDRETLWAGLRQGLVQTVGTDHCPFTLAQKETGRNDFSKIPNGMPGIEHRLELLHSEGVVKGRIGLQKLVEVSSTNAARIFGLFPQKGTIAVGSDADLVLFDPREEHEISAATHHHRCDYSAFEGYRATGRVKTVLLRGTVAIENGTAKIGKGFGRYLARNQFNPNR